MAQKAAAEPPPAPPPPQQVAQQQYLHQHDMYDAAAMPHHYADPTYTTHGYDHHYQYHG